MKMSDPSWLSDSHDEPRAAAKVDNNAPSWESRESTNKSNNGIAAPADSNDVPAAAKYGQFFMNFGMAAFVATTGILSIMFSTGKFMVKGQPLVVPYFFPLLSYNEL